nr:retrotransposon protein, putative, Ty1-copia subclass [Tanacetum cinerariifolium]
MTQNLSVGLILVSLRKNYDGFVQIYNMHSMEKTMTELHAMLKLHEQTLPPKEISLALHAIRPRRIHKNQKKKSHKAAKGNQGKGKAKMGHAPMQAPPFGVEVDPHPKQPRASFLPFSLPKLRKPLSYSNYLNFPLVSLVLACLWTFVEKQKLTGINFMEWYRNLRIVLSVEDKLPFLEQPIPALQAPGKGQVLPPDVLNTHTAWVKASKEIAYLMLMTMDPDIQKNLGSKKLKPGALSLYVGDDHRAAFEAIREFHLCLSSVLVLILHNCHYAPSITRGIISVSRLYNDGFVNRFENDNSISVSKNNLINFNAIPRDDIHEIVLSSSNTNDNSVYALSNKRAKLNLDSALLWHCRLGQISKKRIEKLQHDGLLDSTDIKSFEKCVSCMSGKMARKLYSHQVERATDLLRLIHTNVCGPFKIMSRQGAYYFITFTDDFSRYGEYMSQEFLDHLKEHEIISHRTPPYTPQHNGVSERRNRTLLNMVRSMMSQTTLPKFFWDYALESAARILNMVPTKKVDKTPYKVWHGQALKLSYFKVWGCEALVKRDTLTKPDKLEPRAFKCIFIGYPKETMGYSFYYPPENKVFVARNAEFFENDIIDQEASRSLEDLKIIQEEDTHPSIDTSLNHKKDDQEIDEPQTDINPIRKFIRTRCSPDRMCLYIDAEERELGDLGEPANYKAALLDPESDKWLNAINVEMQSIKYNETDMDEAIHTYKARLVAKGFTQTTRIDYEESFSPVVNIRAIRILIAIAAFYDYKIWQMNVKTSFFNGYLNEEVYMEQLEGFVSQKFSNRVCKLKRSIYELKQASRQWNRRFDDEIKKFRFNQNRDEPCVYVKASGSYVTFLILYVDNILIMGNNIPMLQDVKSYLRRCFAMKDLGEAAYILGIKIYRDRSKRIIGLCQSAYIEKILKRFYMENSKRGPIPMQKKLKFSKSQGASTPAEIQRMQNITYASTVGSVMYVVRCTRPDVAFTQNITSRFQ